MDLYIIRHAWAGAAGDPAWPNDAERPLTPQGQARFRRVVDVLTGRGFRPELILTSPLVRCRQTAEIVARVVTHRPQVVPREELAPGSDLAPMLSWMEQEACQYRRIAWVGHAPDVGHMTAELIGRGPVWIRFAKGAIAAIRFDRFPEAGHGQLRWLITAKLLGV